ncbi:hypothetical protein NUACC26_025100 [Scytonema sp. NUACC26]
MTISSHFYRDVSEHITIMRIVKGFVFFEETYILNKELIFLNKNIRKLND